MAEVRLRGAEESEMTGFTDGKPETRLSTLRVCNPHDLHLLAAIPGGREVERQMHDRFAPHWFHPAAELVSFIDSLFDLEVEAEAQGQ